MWKKLSNLLTALTMTGGIFLTNNIATANPLISQYGRYGRYSRGYINFINHKNAPEQSSNINDFTLKNLDSGEVAVIVTVVQDKDNYTEIWFIGNIIANRKDSFQMKVNSISFDQKAMYATLNRYQSVSQRNVRAKVGECTVIMISQSALAECKAITTEGGIFVFKFER